MTRECCDGYGLTTSRTCAPICLQPCQFGKCVAPHRCECNPAPSASQPGYDGPRCNRFVCSALDRWGTNCDKECHCSETAFCDARTGKCLCRPGWHGANCTEECDQRSGCDDLPYVLPTFEPEVNIIKVDDNVEGRASALKVEPLQVERESDDDKRAFSRMILAHMHIELFLVVLVSGLMFTLFCYKKKLSELKDELYYAAYPASNSSSSDSSTGYRQVRNRPPMPLPGEANQMEKNLSFDMATRNALSEKQNHNGSEHVIIPINKAERHLFMSKELSQNNIYSEIDSNFESPCINNTPKSQLNVVSENEYQVPRSPARLSSETDSHSNLYEELVPNTPAKDDDCKKQ